MVILYTLLSFMTQIKTLIYLIIIFFPLLCSAVQPHIGHYKMTMGYANNETGIINIEGKSIYKLERNCNGWDSNEEIAIIFEFNEGNKSTLLSSWSTFESFSGNAYNFELEEIINDVESEKYFGYANLFNNYGEAKYFSSSKEEGVRENVVEFPKNIEFPMNHLFSIIENAKKKNKVLQSKVFLGSEIEQNYKIVTTIIGEEKQTKIDLEGFKQLNNLYWPINLGYFDPLNRTGEPEFEIFAKLHENGVITNLSVDYGDFSINSEIIKFELVSNSNC